MSRIRLDPKRRTFKTDISWTEPYWQAAADIGKGSPSKGVRILIEGYWRKQARRLHAPLDTTRPDGVEPEQVEHE